MRRSRNFTLKFLLIITATIAALFLSYQWSSLAKNAATLGAPKVAAFTATAPQAELTRRVEGIDVNELLTLTNQERAMLGRPLLTADQGLYVSAANKCQDMASERYFDHFSPSGKNGLEFIETQYPGYGKIAENLAFGFNNATETVAGWSQSPAHRKALLSADYVYVGFAACEITDQDGSRALAVVQHFLKN